MKKIRIMFRRFFAAVLVLVFLLGLVPVVYVEGVQASADRLYLESTIFATNPSTAWGWRAFPASGTFSMGSRTFGRGIQVRRNMIGATTIHTDYDLGAYGGALFLSGTFGRSDNAPLNDFRHATLTVLCADTGRWLGEYRLERGDAPLEVNVSTQGVLRVRISISLDMVTTFANTVSVGFGDAFFTVDPNFQPIQRHTITATAGQGGQIAGGGTFDDGVWVTLEALANTGFTFSGWYEGNARVSANATWQFAATRSMTVQARFTQAAQRFTVTATASPGGTATGGGTLYQDQYFTLIATPNTGFTFSGWYENNTPVSRNATWQFSATRNRTVQARFTQVAQQFTITATAGTGGTVSGGGTRNQGQSITLTATPNTGFTFSGWYENNTRVSTNASWTFNVTENRTVQARFTQTAQQVTIGTITRHVGTEDWGTITVTPGTSTLMADGWTMTTVASGTRVTLTATPRAGYIFTGWYRDNRNAGGQITRVTTYATHSFDATEQHVNFMAAFAREFTVTVTATTGGTATGGGTFNPQIQVVTLRATPNTGFTFSGWYEGNTRVSTLERWDFTPTRNKTIQARFSQIQTQQPPVNNPHSSWAAEELRRAAEQNLIPATLRPAYVDLREPITRAEFAGVVVMAFENIANTTAMPAVVDRFADSRDPYVLRAYNMGLMVGVSSDRFEPNTLLNREQTATALTRSFKRATIPGWTFANDREGLLTFTWPARFADDEQISDWARESVYFMAAHGIILGTGNNRFSPRATTSAQEAQGYATATREQALIIALRMIENLPGSGVLDED